MLRNKELRRFAAWFGAVAAITVILGFSIHPASGLLALASAGAFGTVFYAFTRERYNRIGQLSDEIDRVLHNADHLYVSDSDEGELAILQSEIVKMTRRIREQNDALRKEKERLAGSLADIAHQLRTPLTSANLILSLLEQCPDEPQRKALLQETEELFAQMEWLVNSLLKLSRLDAGIVTFQYEPVCLERLARTAARPLLIAMELHDITLRTDIPAGMEIRGDAGWLSEALQNILRNCVQSIGDHGGIELLCRDTPLFAELTVHDSGPGFAPEDLPHLFDRFYRGKRDGASGYGIGLALCKQIIARHGGTITAKNHPQGGAVFCIRFPK